MTKKHFEALAAILRRQSDTAEGELIANDMADYLATQNPRFNRDKFLTACGF